MRKVFSSFVLVLLVVFFLPACNSNHDVEPDYIPYTPDLTGTSWRLLGFGTKSGDFQLAEPQDNNTYYLLRFEEDGTISGFATSNHIYGYYLIHDDEIELDGYYSTRMSERYPDGYDFINAIGQSSQYEVLNGQLKLYYEKRKKYLLMNPLE